MPFELAAQQAIYTALNGNITATVYDDVPMLPSGQPLSNFPYVVIGGDTFLPWDTDDQLGSNITLTLHIWSRYGGMQQAKSIAGEIYALLHRANLTITGYHVIDCLCEFSEFITDPDGETRHGIVRYRLTMQEVAEVFELFVPLGSDDLITSDGDQFFVEAA